jgi:CBS domain-containing protein
MTRDVVSVHCYTPFKDIARALFDREISAVPVLDDSCHVAGIVSASDLVEQQAIGAETVRPRNRSVSAQTLMTSPVVTVTPETDTAAAARLMYRNAVKHLPVVSGTGRLVGIVSEKDLLTVFLRPDLEIQDEIVRTVILAEPGPQLREPSVRVRDGIVLLGGYAAAAEPVRDAVESIREIDGVIEVVNQVQIDAMQTG